MGELHIDCLRCRGFGFIQSGIQSTWNMDLRYLIFFNALLEYSKASFKDDSSLLILHVPFMCKHATILPGSLSDLCLKSYYISYYNAVVIRT